MKLQTIDEIMNEIEIIPDSELTKQYNKKEFNKNESVESKLGMSEDGNEFGQRIGSPSMSAADFSDNYGLIFFDLTHDPGYNGGMNGCAYTSQLQLVDLNDNLNKLLIESFNYRGTGNSPFNHRINFQQGKILEEKKGKISFGMKSHEVLAFYEFDTKTKEKELIERVDLEYIAKNKEKLEKFDKAFKELDTKAIRDFIEETNYFTTVEKINDNYAIAMLYDPYADTGSRHAKTKLVIKDVGMIDLQHHNKEFRGESVTQGFEFEDIKIKYDGEKIILDYVMVETSSGHSSSGSYWKNTLGKTKHSFELDPKKLKIPVKKGMKLDYLIDKEAKNFLSPGNTNKIPIMMQGFGEESPINYAYRVDKVDNKDKSYVVVSKIIDMENYSANSIGTFAVEQQIKTAVYEATGLEGENMKLKEVASFTTDTNDRKKYLLNVEYNRNKHEMKIEKPRIEILGEDISINYKVKAENFDEKEIRLKL